MENSKLRETITEILKQDDRIWNKEKTELNQTLLLDLLEKIDEKIIDLLLQNAETRDKFFVKITRTEQGRSQDVYVFKTNDFKFFMETIIKTNNLIVKREIDKEVKKSKVGFNELTPSEWALLSKNVINEDELLNPVWNDLSSPRNKYQLQHGAVYPVKLAERIIKMYSKVNDTVLDPFLGIGTTIIAAQSLNRHAIGIELNPKFVEIAEKWLNDVQGIFPSNKKYKIINDDCRNLLNHLNINKVQVTVTSPPYANFIHKSITDRTTTHKKSIITHENNSTIKPYSNFENDFGNLPYKEFLEQIKGILRINYEVTTKGGYSAWVVKDYRDTKNKIPYVAFHSDLAKAGEEVGWKYHDLIVWDQTGQRRLVLLGYPSVFYTNQNCSFIVIFRKVV